MLECHRLEPVDADVDIFRIVAAGYLEIFAARRARTHEHGVKLLPVQQLLKAVNPVIRPQVDAYVDDVADLLVENLRWQAEARDVGAHESAGHIELLENRDLVTERTQIIRDRQRCTAGAD